MGALSQGLLGFGAGAALGAARVYEQEASNQEYDRRQGQEEQRLMATEERRIRAAEDARLAQEKRDRELLIESRAHTAGLLKESREYTQEMRTTNRDADAVAAETDRINSKQNDSLIEQDMFADDPTNTDQYRAQYSTDLARAQAAKDHPELVTGSSRINPNVKAADIIAAAQQENSGDITYSEKVKEGKTPLQELMKGSSDAGDRADAFTDEETRRHIGFDVVGKLMPTLTIKANAAEKGNKTMTEEAALALKEGVGERSAAVTVLWAKGYELGPDTRADASAWMDAAIQTGNAKNRVEAFALLRKEVDARLSLALGKGGDELSDYSSQASKFLVMHRKVFEDVYGPLNPNRASR